MTSLDISANNLTRGSLKPNGWPGNPDGWGSQDDHYKTCMDGVIALSDGIKNNGALATITFGDKQAVTMTTTMTEADFSDKLRGYEAHIVAAFLPKCQ